MSKSFVLPPFANDAVRTAFRELLSREQVLSDLSTNLSMTESRIEKMNNHSIKISKELEEMQNELAIQVRTSESLNMELSTMNVMNDRLKAEILSSDHQAYDLQVLLNNTQTQFIQMSEAVSREKLLLEDRRKELLVLDASRVKHLEDEELVESESRVESVELLKLQDQLLHLTEIYNARSQEARSLETAVVSKRQELDCAIDALRILRKQRDDLHTEMNRLADRVRESEEHLIEMGKLHQETRTRHTLKKRVLVDLQSKLDAVKQEYEVVLKQVDRANLDVGRLSEAVRKANQDLSNLSHENFNREQELSRAVEASKRLIILRENAESQHPVLESEIRKLEKKRDLLQERIALLRQGSSSVDQEISDADKVLNELESEVTEVINHIATHKERILSHATAIESCREEISVLEIELSGLESQMGSLPGQLMHLKDQSTSLDSQLVELEYHIELEKKKLENGGDKIMTESEKSNLMERIKSLESQVGSATNLRNKLQTQIGNQKTEIRLMGKECQLLRDELQSITQKVLETETVVTSLEREDECAQKSLVDLLVFRDKLTADLRDKKKELADMISRIYTTQTELSELQKTVTEKNREHSEKLEELKLVNKGLVQERHVLRKQLWEIQHAGELLAAKLESRKEKEERSQVPEEDLTAYMEEIERLKIAIDKAQSDLDQINDAFGYSGTGQEKELAKLCREKEQLEAQVLLLPSNNSLATSSEHIEQSIVEWNQLVKEIIMKRCPLVYDEFVSLGINLT